MVHVQKTNCNQIKKNETERVSEKTGIGLGIISRNNPEIWDKSFIILFV